MYVNTISGLDMSTTRQEARKGCDVLEAKISSFFTDEFRCFISMQSMADAQIIIYPSRSKITVTRMGFGHSGDSQENSDLYIKWKYLVLTRLMEKIQEDYGSTPFKEANNFITDVKAKAESTIKIMADKTPFLGSIMSNHSERRELFRNTINSITAQYGNNETKIGKKSRRNRTLSVPINNSEAAINLEKTCEQVFLSFGYKAFTLVDGNIAMALTSDNEKIAFVYEMHHTKRNTLFFKENKSLTTRIQGFKFK